MNVLRWLRRIKGKLISVRQMIRACLQPYIVGLHRSSNRRLVIRLDGADCSSRSDLLRTVISLCIQQGNWSLVVTDNDWNRLPWLLRKNRRIIKSIPAFDVNTWVGCVTVGTKFHPMALACIQNTITQEVRVIFCDQRISEKRGRSGWILRPGYSPDFLRSRAYMGEVLFFQGNLVPEHDIHRWFADKIVPYETALMFANLTDKFYHLPLLLYKSADSTVQGDSIEIVNRHLMHFCPGAYAEGDAIAGAHRIHYPLPEGAFVSIIIPNKEHLQDLQQLVDSIYARSSWKKFEILIVENGSTDPALLDYYEKLVVEEKARVLVWKDAYNFAAICNLAAKQAKGKYLLFLNNDMEVISSSWLEEMLMYARRSDVGAVGAKLLYPDHSVQHGGVLMGVGGIAGHAYKHLQPDDQRNMCQLQLVHNCSAVTGACLMVRRELYMEQGGMDETLAVAYNDVDFCLRLRACGLLNVYTPYAELYHYESKSRGSETGEKLVRFRREADYFRSKWQQVLDKGDPYLHPLYSRKDEAFTL